MTWRHNDLQHDLAMHLRAGGERWVWCNIQLGDGGRPDAFTFRPYGQSSHEMVAYEIKVSRSDFMSDMKSGKWQRYLTFAQGVTFAVPQGLVKLKEIPAGCGLIIRSERGWRHTKRPTLQRVSLGPADFIRLLSTPPEWREVQKTDVYHQNWITEKAFHLAKARAGHALGKDIGNYLRSPERAREIVARAESNAEFIVAQARNLEERLDKQRDRLAKILGIKVRGRIAGERAIEKRINEIMHEGPAQILETALREVARAAEKGLAAVRDLSDETDKDQTI